MRVVVRVRPSEESCVRCDPHVGTRIETEVEPDGYEFSSVLGMESTQHEAFQCCGVPLIEAMLDGQHSCLFAYGQTGSGKTFSMLGAEGGKNPHKLNGIVPLVVAELFRRFATMESQGVKCKLSGSFIEVFNESARDLADDVDINGNPPTLGMRQTPAGHVFFSKRTLKVGARSVKIESSRALLEMVEGGMRKRVNDANNYHEHSSRSHAVLTLALEKRTGTTSQTTTITMVDLAGSETYWHRVPHQQINVSLLALGRVLMALAKKQAYVPYRDSVLTRLLQGVLDGGGSICMLACIHPGAAFMGETHAVLEYARTTASIVRSVVRAEIKDIRSAAQKEMQSKGLDPMQNDEFDNDEELLRRTELIETRNHGGVHARCVGDAEDPLILYLHAPRRGCSSADFNGLVVGLAEAVRGERKSRRPQRLAEFTSNSPRNTLVENPFAPTQRYSPRGPKFATRRNSLKLLLEKAKISAAASTEKNATEDEELQIHLVTKFYHLRAHMSNALMLCESELLATKCDLCSLQLRKPSRMLGCRHVLCQLCAESTVQYWDECPVCAKTDTEAFIDPLHAAVLERREADWYAMNAHKSSANYAKVSGITGSWASRLEIALKERQTCRRLTLLYGCELSHAASERVKATWFVRPVDAAYMRQASGESRRDDDLIAEVIIDTMPSSPRIPEDGFLQGQNDPNLGYTLTRVVPGSRVEPLHCDITVCCVPSLGVPPIKIRAVTPRGDFRFRRWVVVQLPQSPSTRDVRLPEYVEVGDGIANQPSAWVVFSTGRDVRVHLRARSFGRNAAVTQRSPVVPVATSLPAPMSQPKSRTGSPLRGSRASQQASQEDDETAKLTLTPLAYQALGQVKEVQRKLALAALALQPLSAARSLSSVDELFGGKLLATAAERERAASLNMPVLRRQQSKIDTDDTANNIRSLRRSSSSREEALVHLLEEPTKGAANPPSEAGVVQLTSSMTCRCTCSPSSAGDTPGSSSGNGSQIDVSTALLRAAASGTSVGVNVIYSQMLELARDASSTTCARLAHDLADNKDENHVELSAYFHVAIDLPGYGMTPSEHNELWSNPAETLTDVLRSLGKTSAHMIYAVEGSAVLVLRALSERPALARCVVLREPTAACDSAKLLMHVLQHVLILSPSGSKLQLAHKLSLALQQGRLAELEGRSKFRGGAVNAVVDFLREVNMNTSAPPFPSRKMPLLTRLAGGIHAWKGTRPNNVYHGSSSWAGTRVVPKQAWSAPSLPVPLRASLSADIDESRGFQEAFDFSEHNLSDHVGNGKEPNATSKCSSSHARKAEFKRRPSNSMLVGKAGSGASPRRGSKC